MQEGLEGEEVEERKSVGVEDLKLNAVVLISAEHDSLHFSLGYIISLCMTFFFFAFSLSLFFFLIFILARLTNFFQELLVKVSLFSQLICTS